MNDENPSNDVQDPAEPHKVTETVVTETAAPEDDGSKVETTHETEVVKETVTESPASDSSE